MGSERNFETSSIEPTLGVWTFFCSSSATLPAADVSPTFTVAISTLAAYSQASHATIASSPESARTWNSALVDPPMAPGSAATMR